MNQLKLKKKIREVIQEDKKLKEEEKRNNETRAENDIQLYCPFGEHHYYSSDHWDSKHCKGKKCVWWDEEIYNCIIYSIKKEMKHLCQSLHLKES